MNNIDKILKEALDGFEAPFDSTMWDKVSSQLSPMEDAFRETLESHEAPYDPKAWSSIKNKISSSWSLSQWIGGTAAAIALISSAIVFWPTPESTRNEELNLALSIENEQVKQDKLNNTPAAPNNNDFNTNNNESNPSEAPIENQLGPERNADHPSSDLTHNTPAVNHTEKDSSSTPRDNGPFTERPPVAEENETIESTVSTAVNAEFKASIYNVCSGTNILFNPKVSKVGTNHLWDFGDGSSTTTAAAAAHSYAQAGIFTVTHTVRENNTNKIVASESQTVTVNALPSAQIIWNQPMESLPTFNFSSSAAGTDQVLWSIDGAVVSDKLQYQQTLRQKGVHVIELSVKNAQGCKQSAEEVIEIEEDYNLFAPTVFTPNFDGNNDVFIPVALTLLDKNFEMFIYDIEGHLLFQTNNANNPWDGRDARTHVEAEDGVYVWFVTLTNEKGEQEIYRGQVLLAR